MYKRINVYPNGTPIPDVLPDSYQPASYGNAPTGQSCFTCKHFNLATRYCDKWKAPVKPKWWCAAWEAPMKATYSNTNAVLSKKIITSTVEEHFSQIPNSELKLMDYDFYNEEDVIKLNVPLMIRLLEWAREDASKDIELHTITEKLIELCEDGDVLGMTDYETIVGTED
jgi:hypothetical protein